MENEKDCTDELIECTTECDTNDKECESECVEQYNDCVIPEEPTTALLPEGDLIAEVLQITALLGGTCTRQETLNSQGRSSKQIIIEYDVKERRSH